MELEVDSKYYKSKIFSVLDSYFTKNKKVLDLGCGDGSDARIIRDRYKSTVVCVDVYRDNKFQNANGISFKKGSIFRIPFKDHSFDIVFCHDVLHHIDEKNQSRNSHLKGLRELKRVCKRNGLVIILEGNRYNPLFYFHMVKLLHHNHFRQSYFKSIIREVFPNAKFTTFEAHAYPNGVTNLFKLYEKIIGLNIFEKFHAYNLSVAYLDE